MTEEEVFIRRIPLLDGMILAEFQRRGGDLSVRLKVSKEISAVYGMIFEYQTLPGLKNVLWFLTLLDAMDVDITEEPYTRALEGLILRDFESYRQFSENLRDMVTDGNLPISEIIDRITQLSAEREIPEFPLRPPGSREKKGRS